MIRLISINVNFKGINYIVNYGIALIFIIIEININPLSDVRNDVLLVRRGEGVGRIV